MNACGAASILVALAAAACSPSSSPPPSGFGPAEAGASFDAGPSRIGPGETPDEHYPDGFACSTESGGDGGIDRCGDPVAIGCCHTDADCVHGFSGHCSVEDGQRIGLCSYADRCASSSDCSTDTTCVCGNSSAPGNRCVRSVCRSDSECGAGSYCSPSRTSCFNGVHNADGVYCHTPDDRCLNDRDCPTGEVCGFVPEHALWTCITVSCGAG